MVKRPAKSLKKKNHNFLSGGTAESIPTLQLMFLCQMLFYDTTLTCYTLSYRLNIYFLNNKKK